MLLNISGFSSPLGLRLIDETKLRQLSQLQQEPQNERAKLAFLEGIGAITTPKELTDNFQVYSFVMRAFDLEDQIFGRGLMRKMLESDPNDRSSLVNRLTDGRFKVIHDALGFAKDASERPDFSDPAWQATIVDRYFNQVFENSTNEQNTTVGTVLKLRREAPELNNWFQILRDKGLSEFFRTALGLPQQIASLDIDKQKSIFEKEFDLRTLNDRKVQEDLINQYMIISDIQKPISAAYSPAISLLRASSELGVIVSINVPQVSISASSLFR